MRHVFVQGASRGLGRAFVHHLLARGDRVTATARDPSSLDALVREVPDRLTTLRLDLEAPDTIETAAQAVGAIDWVINVSGLLHDGELQPEKKLDHADADSLHRLFQVNSIGPLLVARHLHRKLARDGVFASLSARVGSIEDNRLGGWYGYRASKAAQNMFTKTLSIEWGRSRPERAVVALHPGTVATELSAPFRRHAKTVFPVERAAAQLIDILDGLTGADTGRFIAWDGTDIPW